MLGQQRLARLRANETRRQQAHHDFGEKSHSPQKLTHFSWGFFLWRLNRNNPNL
jgi:hypothetical protein